MEHFKKNAEAEVALLLTNNADAYVLQRADNFEIPSQVFDKEMFYHSDTILKMLHNLKIDLIVLAGFLWLIPEYLLEAYPRRIINIHPALLPAYSGKGMFGKKVHQAILDNHEIESGITIHYINEHFDEGEIIHQAKFKIEKTDDLEMIMYKCQQLEHQYYPKIIENLIKKMDLR